MSSMSATHETDCETPSPASELDKNTLATRVAVASRKAGSPINAYHARADIDEHIRLGYDFHDLPGLYTRHYGLTV